MFYCNINIKMNLYIILIRVQNFQPISQYEHNILRVYMLKKMYLLYKLHV